MVGRPNRYALFGVMLALIPAADVGALVDGGHAIPVPSSVGSIAGGQPGGGLAVVGPFGPELPLPKKTMLLREAIAALDAGDAARTLSIRNGFPEKSLEHQILSWVLARNSALSSAETAEVVRSLPGWPGMAAMGRNIERAMAREKPDPNAVPRFFGEGMPATYEGTLMLARARVALGETEKAKALLAPYWRRTKLEATAETTIMSEFGGLLSAADHRVRMEQMLYLERVDSAGRVAKDAGAPELAKAWTAMIRGAKDAGKLLDEVPETQRSAGWYFAKAKQLRRDEKFAEAAAVMLKAPADADALIDPDAWWIERRVLSRELLDNDDVKTAYAVAAAHSAESPVNAADAEFHAGWYALQGLKDAATAAKHFARIIDVSEGPISLSRAHYWLGRAAEKGGPGKAEDHFAKAAAYGTTFYGQLAAARLGRRSIDVSYPAPGSADRLSFERREPVRAIDLLEKAGAKQLASRLYLDLAAEITSPGEIAMLSRKASGRGDHFIALKVGKIAASSGVQAGALSHPVGAIPAAANISGSGKALAYAIARQESEFNVAAISRAGARGLLQLMPGTAKEVAAKEGLPFSQGRLTTDAAYNATLGAAYLGEQLGRFDGSYVLTFIGYNAGPGRARDWIKRYGDPRGKDVDEVVDWIERIPFAETRSYVQRVMENYQVYKMRLSGTFDIVGDLRDGRS